MAGLLGVNQGAGKENEGHPLKTCQFCLPKCEWTGKDWDELEECDEH